MKQLDNSSDQLNTFLHSLTIALVLFLLVRPATDADMWWHLRAGQEMWQQKTILLTDQFSFTRAGTPWVNAFWISEVVLYLIYKLGGFFGLSIFVALMGAVVFGYIYAHLPGHPLIKSSVTLLAALTASPVWGPRPQLLSFLFLAYLDHQLFKFRNKQQSQLWTIPILFALWANVHGGWIWGVLLIIANLGGYLMEKIIPTGSRNYSNNHLISLVIVFFASVFAIGFNPNGLGLWFLPFHTVDVSLQIHEWRSPDFHRPDLHPLLWMLFLLIIAASFKHERPEWHLLFSVLGFGYLTFISQRNIAPFAIIAAPILANWTNDAAIDYGQKKRGGNKQINEIPKLIRIIINNTLLLVLFGGSLGRAYVMSQSKEIEKGYPSQAIAWLRENPINGNMLNSYNWGGYLIWALPEKKVFIDGRADLYGDEIISQWNKIVYLNEDCWELLDFWDINLILLEPGWPISLELPQHGWDLVYDDETAQIYRRRFH